MPEAAIYRGERTGFMGGNVNFDDDFRVNYESRKDK